MKKKLFSFAAVCVIFAAVFAMTGCPTPDDDDGKPSGNTTKSNVATLNSIKFGNETANMGTPAATYAAATEGTVTILQPTVTVTVVKTNAAAAVEFAHVASGSSLKEDDFWPEGGPFTMETGDKVAIKVTAENGTTIRYYKIGVTLADVALASLTVGGSTVVLPSAGSTWQTAGGSAFVLFTYPADEQPAAGLAIAATTQTQGATIQYAKVTGAAEPTFSDNASITFADGDYLYIKVTGTSGSAYYKVQVNFAQSGTIKYGKQIFNAEHTQPADLSVWNDPTLEVYTFGKIYANDSGTLLDPNQGLLDAEGNPKTKAWAKALWDEEGIYIYLDVTDPDMSTVDNEHESDSFELFVNEGYPETIYANSNPQGGGSQYRLALNGQVSGEGGSPDAFRALGKWASWKKADNSGYIQVLQAPWRLRQKFYSATSYRNDWSFGFELQLNVAGETGNRYGVLVWNNISHTNYQNATDYGVAKLIGQTGALAYPALPPVINTQPAAKVDASPGDTVNFTVSATSLESGSLSYQWYTTATGSVADGTAINGATSATAGVSALEGTNYYYVVVTNTITTGNPKKTETATSTIVPLIAGGNELPSNWIDKIEITAGTAMPVYGFNLPAGDTFGDYDRIKFTLKFDAASDALTQRRMRAWGNYDYATWTAVDTRPGMENASPNGLLLSTKGTEDYTAGAWADYTIQLDNRNTLTTADAIKATTGVVLLAFGPAPPGGGTGHNYYYIKDITLENADGTKSVSALHPESPLLWGGNGASAFVTQDFAGGNLVNRTLIIPTWQDKIEITAGTAMPVYGFNLPSGDIFGDYDRIKFTLKFDAASDALTQRRMRAWGNYDYATWTAVDTRPGMENASPNGLLLSTKGTEDYTAGAWADYTIQLDNRNTLTTADAIKATTGVVLLAFGPAPPGGGTGHNYYYIKDITLENADGTKSVSALHPESPLLWGGNGASAFVTQDFAGGNLVVRELGSADPTE